MPGSCSKCGAATKDIYTHLRKYCQGVAVEKKLNEEINWRIKAAKQSYTASHSIASEHLDR